MGATAWLVDLGPRDDGGGARAAALVAALTAQPPAGMVQVRRGATTVLVRFVDGRHARRARDLLAATPLAASVAAPTRTVTLEVVYQGDDLDEAAAALGCSVPALVAEHAGTVWTADFCGFAPGFAYLSGWSRSVARRSSPRTWVPAGAVGLADGWTAAYPAASPGGWQLIGSTTARLWDPDRAQPSLIEAGDLVRLRPVRAAVTAAAAGRPARVPAPTGTGLRMVAVGRQALVQDGGRGGHEHLGVPGSGAAVVADARRANRVLGNPRDAAVLEWVGDLAVAAEMDLVVALTGIAAAELTLPGADPQVAVPSGTATALPRGAVLRAGGRAGPAYLAVRGGLDVAPVLGSRASDVLSGTGPPPLAVGDVVPVGTPTGVVGAPEPDQPDRGPAVVRVHPGPRSDWVDAASLDRLCAQGWVVGPVSRVGLRLSGGRLTRTRHDELPSEPMVPGAIQVPPSGEPVVLLRDHPVTGGYPVVAVVDPADLDRLGRLGPGDTVHLVR